MQKVHFIAIGGDSMHNLAIAISKKNNFQVTGSDDSIFEPSLSRLTATKLLPDELGWFPERIHKGLSAVIVGMNTTVDNPELIRAKELGLKIYSFPEYLFQQTRSKTRIVVAGSHGKTTTTAIILFVLKQLRINTDYMLCAQIDGFDDKIKLSYESRIAVFEGDECPTSIIDKRSKFHYYKPHIAVLTGLERNHTNAFPTFDIYVEQFRKFTDLMEVQGRLIYFDGDKNLNKISANLRRDIVAFPYNTPEHEVRNGITFLKTRKGEVALKLFGEHNLQNLNAARLACRQIGVTDEQFYEAVAKFKGVWNKLQKRVEIGNSLMYTDFAHSPMDLNASISALKLQYPDKQLVACFELCDTAGLSANFLAPYTDSMANADLAFVYYDPNGMEMQSLNQIMPVEVRNAFNRPDLMVYNTINDFQLKLRELNYDNSVLLFASRGSFSGINLIEFATGLFIN